MESTLTLTRSQLKSSCGFFLGWGRGADFGDPDYSTDQITTLDQIVSSGLRRFYYPPQDTGFYDWAFLRPVTTQFLPVGASTLQLPDDFGGIQGGITCSVVGTSATGNVWWSVNTCNEAQVRLSYANLPTATGRPLQAAVVPLRGTQIQAGQRFLLAVFPQADQVYQLQFCYTILADALTDNVPIPLGGAQHAETILESCLAVAEERLDDQAGVHARQFQILLKASMAQDRRMKPQTLGYNADRSDQVYGRYYDRPLNPITIAGQLYGP